MASTTTTKTSETRDGFEGFRVRATSQLRRYLTDPHVDDEQREAARAEVADLVAAYVIDRPGILILTSLPATEDTGTLAILRFTRLIGDALPQDREGTLVRQVRDRGTAIGEGTRARYAESRFGGDIHTDAAERPLPVPDMFTLFCVRQSSHGGALRVVHIRDLEPELARSPEVTATLQEGFNFDRRGDQDIGELPVTEKPILFKRRDRLAITYLRSYIELGHQHEQSASLTATQVAALDALDKVAYSSASTKVGKLREGELALFDNLSILHGRTEFQDDPSRTRLLLRTWIRTN